MKYLKEGVYFFGFKNFVPWSRDLPHPIEKHCQTSASHANLLDNGRDSELP